MNNKEFEALIKIPVPKRYEHFIKKVVDWEEVWGLFNYGWAIISDKDGNKMIPFLFKKEFALYCAKEEWADYTPKNIELNDFIEKWLPGMKKEEIKPAIFFNNINSAVLSVDTLLNDLKQELENY
ncbi:DUF2750 domain-containing protein [Desulfosporosinus sp. BICA1-9]|uniref:DUF2750 domain-containing protein n=1 Tax=Desulfosporosinus sp. BICA1-9 TaxID=1531958 RepID=UPI00054C4CD4|nr:DUF2750 domain-containing protein [Desulfosporosinus sp. BICA1-9]KJS84409.1 MAG: hypothetical protein JL57_20720 [Desulfosporosinus sp. BICA1-9]HBW38916.1 DUF2750 domain-containing protein [Desulfosporosinus sp.]